MSLHEKSQRPYGVLVGTGCHRRFGINQIGGDSRVIVRRTNLTIQCQMHGLVYHAPPSIASTWFLKVDRINPHQLNRIFLFNHLLPNLIQTLIQTFRLHSHVTQKNNKFVSQSPNPPSAKIDT